MALLAMWVSVNCKKMELKNMEESNNEKRKKAIGAGRPSQRRTVGQTTPCEVCGATQWDEDEKRGETFCGNCGHVSEVNAIDPGAEWTNYTDGADRSRVGAPPRESLADKGLNTTISRGDISGAGARIHGIKGSEARSWRRRVLIDERSKNRSSRTRNLTRAMQFIRDRANLPPSLVEEACRLYRYAANENIVTGRSIRGVSAACAYIAAREAHLPRSIEEIAESFDMTDELAMKELTRTIRLLSRCLGAHHITGPGEYLDKFHSDLNLPAPVLGEANKLWSRVGDSMEWQGKKPAGVAAAMLYMAAKNCDYSQTQSQVCKVAGVSEVTLRGLMRILEKLLALLDGEAN
ncbi:MAG: transcription initiation factor IIB family protein [Candidatus Thalassarchaeum sp.]|nr:transcription initiation factor IIB family protein [Candidatus Thalassarchaeum sp.]